MAIAIAAIFCLNDLFGYPLRFVAPVSVLLVFSGLTVISWDEFALPAALDHCFLPVYPYSRYLPSSNPMSLLWLLATGNRLLPTGYRLLPTDHRPASRVQRLPPLPDISQPNSLHFQPHTGQTSRTS
jgi:hypothetical protein